MHAVGGNHTSITASRTPGLLRGQGVHDRTTNVARPAPAGRRLAVGDAAAELRHFADQRSTRITPSDAMVHLVVLQSGRMVAMSATHVVEAESGTALLLARPERTDCVWLAGTSALILHLNRARIQAHASVALAAPSRLASQLTALPFMAGDPLQTAIARLWTAMAAGEVLEPPASAALEQAIIEGLVDSLCDATDAQSVFSVAHSVKRAVDHIRAYPIETVSQDDLAGIAGVTLGTLRRNFRTCLGMTISAFTQQARLDWVHERLGCVTESRSVRQLAAAAGFATANALGRPYQRQFGETPSRTRARIFGTMRG